MPAPRPQATVAHLLYSDAPPVRPIRIIRHLALAAGMAGAEPDWIGPDMVRIALAGDRLILALHRDRAGDYPFALSLALGSDPAAPPGRLAQRQDVQSRMLVDRLCQIAPPQAVLWHHAGQPLTADLIVRLAQGLPTVAADRLADGLLDRLRAAGADRVAAATVPANDAPDPALAEATRLRAALYEPLASPNTALRLAAHALNASMVAICLPVGAAAMTYTFLRGEDLTASARMLALLGLAAGVQGSGLVPVPLPFA
jgi:hypothetical protein